MSRVKYSDPFAMGNLSDLGFARENDDLEYLKEWTRKAVPAYGEMRGIQLEVFKRLIDLSQGAALSVKDITGMLKDAYENGEA